MTRQRRNLVVVLGDQLSPQLASFQGFDPSRDLILMAEVMAEATYVRHHKQKIAFIFSAMRHFADALRQDGLPVRYTMIDDPENAGSFTGEVLRAIETFSPERIIVTEPGEWRVLKEIQDWRRLTGLPVEILDDHRFLCSRSAFAAFARGRSRMTMELFYRDMRRKTGLLMEGDMPIGGKWNFDSDNRKPAKPDLLRPRRRTFAPDPTTQTVIETVERLFPHHFGSLSRFGFAVTRQDAERLLEDFIRDHLPAFGATQDAMLADDPFLNHALLSFYINIGFLDPLSVSRAAERAYLEGHAPLNAVEGFIRQIIGWREYVRGVYWLKGPDYAQENFLDHHRPLPAFYWTGKTAMNCVSSVVRQTADLAYAHHIQRLMITGNFALLAGLDPHAVHEWYLEVYADAFEWVELPNVIGMSQFADGGFLGTKPYAASANYINRMSDYCGSCAYDPKKRTGEGGCPFNALYWDFLARHEDKLGGNHRLAQPYATWNRMGPLERQAIRAEAEAFLSRLDRAQPV